MPARFESQYRKIGYFARSHGNDGKLLLMSDYPIPSLAEDHPIVRYQNERDDLVPARIQNVEAADARRGNAFFVKLAHIDDRHGAESLKGRSIWVEKAVYDEMSTNAGAVPYNQYEVIDPDENTIGTVVNGFETPGQQIIEIEMNDGKQLMVPLVDEFILEVDKENRRLFCQNLEILKEV